MHYILVPCMPTHARPHPCRERLTLSTPMLCTPAPSTTTRASPRCPQVPVKHPHDVHTHDVHDHDVHTHDVHDHDVHTHAVHDHVVHVTLKEESIRLIEFAKKNCKTELMKWLIRLAVALKIGFPSNSPFPVLFPLFISPAPAPSSSPCPFLLSHPPRPSSKKLVPYILVSGL
jgi:hypothetical protein